MEILIFAVGMIVGLIIRDRRGKNREKEEVAEEKSIIKKGERAQFFEPIGTKEAFEESKTIDEFINKQQ